MSDSIKNKLAEAMHELKSKIPFLQGGEECSVSRVDGARVTATKLKALEKPAAKSRSDFQKQMESNGQDAFPEARLTQEQVKKTQKELTQNRLKALSPEEGEGS